MSYEVYMLNNFTYGEDDASRTLGVYDTYGEARKAAQTMVDRFLIELYQPGMSARELCGEFAIHRKSPLLLRATTGQVSRDKMTVSKYIQARARQICTMAISAGIDRVMA